MHLFFREMQAMKELVCTICESVTNSEFAIRRNYSEQNNNIVFNEYSNREDNNKFVSYNDYIQSCQVSQIKLRSIKLDQIRRDNRKLK